MSHSGAFTAAEYRIVGRPLHLSRTIDRERGDDGGASGPQHLAQAVAICHAVGFVGQEMKGGPIVPDVDRPRVPGAG